MGFAGRCAAPWAGGRAVVEIAESEGIDATIEQLVLDALDRDPTIGAVYSIGGGNVATIRAFEQRGHARMRGRPARVIYLDPNDRQSRG